MVYLDKRPFKTSNLAVLVFDRASIKVTFTSQKSSELENLRLPGGESVSFYSYAYPIGIDTGRAEMLENGELFEREGDKIKNPCLYKELTGQDLIWDYGGKRFEFVKHTALQSATYCETAIGKYFNFLKLKPQIELVDLDIVVISVYHHLLREFDVTDFPHTYENEYTLGMLRSKITGESESDLMS